MMRAALVGAGTVVGVGAVLALNPTGASTTALSIPLVPAGTSPQNGAPFGPSAPPGEPSPPGTTSPAPLPHASPTAQHASRPVTSTPRPAATRTRSTPVPKPSPTPTPRPTPSTATATGPVVDVGYGQFGVIQVQATVSGGRIVDIEPVRLPDYEQTSVLISEQAWPILKQEALQAQSAQIANVTGASFTTQGFEQSLRAALIALGHSA